MPAKRRVFRPYEGQAIALVEDSLSIILRHPSSLLAYYTGSIPFLLTSLFFWSEMSRNPFAYRYTVESALVLVLSYVWMKVWQTVYTRQLYAGVSRTEHPSWTLSRIFRTAIVQTALQSTSLVMVPAAALAAIPFAWIYAFYQNITILDSGDQRITAIMSKSWTQAKLWPRQNHILIWLLSPFFFLFGFMIALLLFYLQIASRPELTGNPDMAGLVTMVMIVLLWALIIFSPLSCVIFINIAIALVVLPQLSSAFLGIENQFTISGTAYYMNSTFLVTATMLTWFIMDPVVKAAYVLRCFYGESINNGADLRVSLSLLSGNVRKAIVVVCLLGLTPLSAQEAPPSENEIPRTDSSKVSDQQLADKVKQVLERREFTWRLPRETVQASDDETPRWWLIEWLENFFRETDERVNEWAKWFNETMRKIMEAIFGKNDKKLEPTAVDSTEWIALTKWILVTLVIIGIVVLCWFMFTAKRRRRGLVAEPAPIVEPPRPDLEDESTIADELPQDEWMTLADELMAKGEFRLALRAIYFSSLSHLASRNYVRIVKSKTNGDYVREVRKRAPNLGILIESLRDNIRTFERSWYGEHFANQANIDDALNHHARIKEILEA